MAKYVSLLFRDYNSKAMCRSQSPSKRAGVAGPTPQSIGSGVLIKGQGRVESLGSKIRNLFRWVYC